MLPRLLGPVRLVKVMTHIGTICKDKVQDTIVRLLQKINNI